MTTSILSLGLICPSPLVEFNELDNPRSLFEFDIVIVSWIKYINDLRQAAKENRGYINSPRWAVARDALTSRNNSIHDFIEHKGLVIAIADWISDDLKYSDGNYSYGVELIKYLPRGIVKSSQLQGMLIEAGVNIPTPLQKFVSSLKDHLNYFSVLPGGDGVPVMNIAGTQKPIAIWYPAPNGGGMLLCPPPKRTHEAYDAFPRALIELYKDLTEKPCDNLEPLPDWHSNFQLPEEVALSNKLGEMQNALELLELSINEKRERLEEVIFLKRLFSDKGDSLLSAAEKAFNILGFSVSLGPIGRDDLILVDNLNNRFVVEVKGRDSRGSAESDAAQLEKWVSGFYHQNEIEPKGILVINGHRNIPLDERKEAVFPDQMLTYVKRKEHCLISGYQLLSLVLAFQRGTISQEEIQREIHKSVGILPIFPNVSDCLSLLHYA